MTITALTLVLLAGGLTPDGARANDVRGLSATQTANYNGYYTAYSPAGYAYATNPAYATAGGYAAAQYPAAQYSATQYTAGYAPMATGAKTYAARRHPANVGYYSYRPAYLVTRPTRRAAQTAMYATQAVNYAPQAVYYAPAPANAAPALTLGATANSATQATYYAPPAPSYATAQPTAAYVQAYRPVAVPPTFVYRTTTARVPVTYYRPVVVYDPVTSVPVTCQQPTIGSECQTQRQRCGLFSWLFGRNNSCGSSCGYAPTTSYCGTAACGQSSCGAQPYYPAVQAPATTIIQQPATVIQQPGTIIQTQPSRVIPAMPTQPSGSFPFGSSPSTVPAPPTRFPGTVAPSTIPSTGVPASERPRLTPSGTVFPDPSGYPPVTDPSSGSSSSNYSPPASGSASSSGANSSSTGTTKSNGGNGYPATGSSLRLDNSSGPQIGTPNSSIQPVPDPDYNSRPRMPTRAPQLIDPRDKTAQAETTRWAVVPAVWAKPHRDSAEITPVAHRDAPPIAESPYLHRAAPAPVIDDSQWDDSGWKSAR
jgi:hypothetical protein